MVRCMKFLMTSQALTTAIPNAVISVITMPRLNCAPKMSTGRFSRSPTHGPAMLTASNTSSTT